jgi:hypothetical protein
VTRQIRRKHRIVGISSSKNLDRLTLVRVFVVMQAAPQGLKTMPVTLELRPLADHWLGLRHRQPFLMIA